MDKKGNVYNYPFFSGDKLNVESDICDTLGRTIKKGSQLIVIKRSNTKPDFKNLTKNEPYTGCIWVKTSDGTYEGCLHKHFFYLSIETDKLPYLYEILVNLNIENRNDNSSPDCIPNYIFQVENEVKEWKNFEDIYCSSISQGYYFFQLGGSSIVELEKDLTFNFDEMKLFSNAKTFNVRQLRHNDETSRFTGNLISCTKQKSSNTLTTKMSDNFTFLYKEQLKRQFGSDENVVLQKHVVHELTSKGDAITKNPNP